MNILWCIEGFNKNPNYKISVKLATLMAKKHNVYIALYGGEKQESYLELINDFKNVISLEKELSFIEEKPLFMIIKKLIRKVLRIDLFCTHRLKKICTDNNIDIVIGSVFPYKIAKIISKAKIKSKKFILQLDPYSSNLTMPLNKKNKRIKEELLVLNSIDKLFTTKLIKNDLVSNLNSVNKNLSSRINIIEFPEISEDDNIVNKTKTLINNNDDSVTLSYTGTFYQDIRNPKFLIDFLKVLPQNYKLIIAGMNSNMIHEYDSEVKNRIIDLGFLEQKEVENLRESSDILICFNNLTYNQVPSKLFECIETGKPFINLCQLKNCPTLPYIKDYPNCLTVFVDNIESQKIIDFVENNKDIRVPREEILKKYYKHTYKYVENQIEKEIN